MVLLSEPIIPLNPFVRILLKKNPYNPKYFNYDEQVKRICQELATRDSALFTMAATDVLPFDMSLAHTTYKKYIHVSSSKIVKTEAMYSARTDKIAVVPLFARLFTAGSTSLELKTIWHNSRSDAAYQAVKDIYEIAARFFYGLVVTLAKKEDRSLKEVYFNIRENLFTTEEDEYTCEWQAFCLVGHTIGIEGLPYYTSSDVYATLYGDIEQSNQEKITALKAAKRNYPQYPENEYLIALVDYKQDITPIAIHKISERAAQAIGMLNPKCEEFFYTKQLVAIEPRPFLNSDKRKLNKKIHQEAEKLARPEVKLNEGIARAEISMFRNFESLREDLQRWYNIVKDPQKAINQTEELNVLIEQIVNPRINRFGRAIKSIWGFPLLTRLLVAEAEKDPVKEDEEIQSIINSARHFGNHFLECDVIDSDFDYHGGISGWGLVIGRRKILANYKAKVQQERAVIAAKEEEKERQKALTEISKTLSKQSQNLDVSEPLSRISQ